MATVELRQVRKRYGAVEAIRGIDLEVADGEFVVLLGPSGCGKSTLLRMVAGLETVTAGEVRIGGRLVNEVEPKDRDIAMVFQNYALYPHMSVFDNLAYGLKLRGLPRAEITARVDQAAAILELGGLLTRKPRQLSGGQRQRVAMGRAIVREPAVFLFDEPLSNLDAKLRTQMRVEIKRLQARLDITSLYVTHDQVEAMTLADRLVVINHGVAEQIGQPLDVYRQPATRFVAGFIGSPAMNFLLVQADGQDRARLVEGGGLLPVALPGPEGRPVVLGIRPEHLMPAAPDQPGAWAVSVDLVEALGADTVVHGRLAGSSVSMVARLAGSAGYRYGDTLWLRPVEGAHHHFAPDTGRRLGTDEYHGIR